MCMSVSCHCTAAESVNLSASHAGHTYIVMWSRNSCVGVILKAEAIDLRCVCCVSPAGNLETLLTTPTSAGIDVRAAVADFHQKYYRCAAAILLSSASPQL